MYEAYLRQLLSPLGVYDLSGGSVNGGELHALGQVLDRTARRLETVERESVTATAEGEGLDRREAPFARRPAAVTAAERREAIAALLQIDGDSLTPSAINRCLQGCGIRAEAQEVDTGHLRVVFPGVNGVPAEFEQIEKIILDILPCHLEVEFYFRLLTWEECEALQYTWEIVHQRAYTWHQFQMAVSDK